MPLPLSQPLPPYFPPTSCLLIDYWLYRKGRDCVPVCVMSCLYEDRVNGINFECAHGGRAGWPVSPTSAHREMISQNVDAVWFITPSEHKRCPLQILCTCQKGINNYWGAGAGGYCCGSGWGPQGKIWPVCRVKLKSSSYAAFISHILPCRWFSGTRPMQRRSDNLDVDWLYCFGSVVVTNSIFKKSLHFHLWGGCPLIIHLGIPY